MAVSLSFAFAPDSSVATECLRDDPLFSMLEAIRAHGSIGRAAVALGLSYRHVWGVLKAREQGFGEPLLKAGAGRSARLSAMAERLLRAHGLVRARLQPVADILAARLDAELQQAVRPALRQVVLAASHDLLLAPLREALCRAGGVLLDLDYVAASAALERLNRGDCELAGVHLPLDDAALCRRGGQVHRHLGRLLRLGDHKLIRVAHRELGLLVAQGNPLGVTGMKDLAGPGLTWVQRQTGSTSRVVAEELLAAHGVRFGEGARRVVEEPNDLAVAACVAAGEADCGFGPRAAAASFGLDFVPVLTDQYFIVCRKPALGTSAVQGLLEVLRDAAWRDQVGAVPGHSAADAGDIISLRRTLPWYK